jgi:hypothetical protein
MQAYQESGGFGGSLDLLECSVWHALVAVGVLPKDALCAGGSASADIADLDYWLPPNAVLLDTALGTLTFSDTRHRMSSELPLALINALCMRRTGARLPDLAFLSAARLARYSEVRSELVLGTARDVLLIDAQQLKTDIAYLEPFSSAMELEWSAMQWQEAHSGAQCACHAM